MRLFGLGTARRCLRKHVRFGCRAWPDILHRVQLAIVAATIGRSRSANRPDRRSPHGRRDRQLISMRCAGRRCRTRAFPLRGKSSRRGSVRKGFHVHRRVSLRPMRASSCHHSSISTPFSLARMFGGERLDGQLVLRVVALLARQLAPDRGLVGERSKSHRARCAANDVTAGTGPASTTSATRLIGVSFEGAPGGLHRSAGVEAQHPVANDLQTCRRSATHPSCCHHRRPRPTQTTAAGSRPWSSSRGAAVRRCQNRSVSR